VIGEASLLLRDMTLADIDVVLSIEQQIHAHPWTRGNFTDSLASGHICNIYEDPNEIVGYAVLMPVVDEVHLLDIGIKKDFQRSGLGKKLLGEMLALARAHKYTRMILEVRPSNLAALAMYHAAGFREIGLRRGYYPAQHGREDAVVMEHKLQ